MHLNDIVSNKTIDELKELLSNNKLSLNDTNDSGETLLMISIRTSQPILAMWLIKNGASLNHPNNEGEFPIDYVAKFDDYKLLDICLEQTNKEYINAESLFKFCIDREHLNNICQLFKHNINPEGLDPDYLGRLAFLLAKNNVFSHLSRFIHLKMNVDYTKDDGKNVLMLALGYEYYSFIEDFFQYHKPDLLRVDKESNKTIFDMALRNKSFNFMGKFYHLFNEDEKEAYDSLKIENILINY